MIHFKLEWALYAQANFAICDQERFLKSLRYGEHTEALKLLDAGVEVNETMKETASHQISMVWSEDTIKLIDRLGVSPVKLGKTYPSSVLLEKLSSFGINPEEVGFLNEYHEIQHRVILAHALNLEGNSSIRNVSFTLEGSRERVMREAFLASFSGSWFQKQPKNIIGSLRRMNHSTVALHRTQELGFQSEFASNIGADRHSFSFYYHPVKKLLLVGNRGERPSHIPSGILVFSMLNAEESSVENLLTWLQKSDLSSDVYEQLYSKLFEFKYIDAIELPEQSVGNCTWAALGLIALSYIYADSLDTMDALDAKTYVRGIATPLFKQIKMHVIEAYLDRDSPLKSKELLESCYHFAAGAELKGGLFGLSSCQPGDGMYTLWTSVLDAELMNKAVRELQRLGYDAPPRDMSTIAVALPVQTALIGLIGLGLHRITSYVKWKIGLYPT